MKLQNEVALVTGASRGIGREVALLLASEGAAVGVNFRSDEAAAEEVVNAIRQSGGQASLVQGDVSIPNEANRCVEKVVNDFGSIDILVNNAGVTRDGLLVSMSDDDLRTVIETNLLGTIYCTRAAALKMVLKRRGRIVNISSIAARKPNRGQSNYAAAKGGVESFTLAAAAELGARNVLVNAVAPGIIETDMTRRIRDMAEKEILSRILVKRFGNVSDIARAVLFLVSSENSYITGEILNVNGGVALS